MVVSPTGWTMSKREEHWGIVIDNDDPEKRGRIVIQCDTIAEGDVLEWVEPRFHFVDSSDEEKGGCFWVPNIGAEVIVSVEAEDDSEATDLDPQWSCALYSHDGVPDQFLENYPQRRGWVTRAGHVLYLDDTEDQLSFYYEHPSGAKITVDNDGNIRLDTDQSVYIGKDASHPITRGDILETFLTDIVNYLSSHIHTAGSYLDSVSGVVTGISGTPNPVPSIPSIPSNLNSEDHEVD